MLNLSLSGCGFLGIYHVGVISAFKEHGDPCFLQKISGCSAGSLVAACALCDCCLGQMVSDVLEIALKARSHALGPLHPSFNIVEILKNGLRRILPVDAHKICSGRLHVSLTRWKDGKNVIVNQFDSREELIQALLCSSFVPCYSGFIPPKFKGVYFWDGGLTNNNPVLDENTILVAPFGGEMDICPRDESGSYCCFDFNGTTFQWSHENIYRISKALFPPHPEILKAICFRGYKDAVSFLKSRNLLQCSCNFSREKNSISSVFGEDLTLPMFDSEFENQVAYDSEEDQIIQYADSNAPLNYKEMPTSVCDILDAACEDNKGILNTVYDSQISRALSIMMLPWTLPIEFSLGFSKKLLELLPKIKVSNNPSNLLDNVLIQINFLIQKLTYDKYQYHTRVTCKLCLPSNNRRNKSSSSSSQNFQIKFCYHSNSSNKNSNNNNNNNNSNGYDEETNDEHADHVHSHDLMTSSYPKLCARHRVPSVCSSDHKMATYRSRAGTSSNGNQTTADLNDFNSSSKLNSKRTRRKRTYSRNHAAEALIRANSSLVLSKQQRLKNKSSEKLELENDQDNRVNSESSSKSNKTHSRVHFHLSDNETETKQVKKSSDTDLANKLEAYTSSDSTDHLLMLNDNSNNNNKKVNYSNNLTDDIKSANQFNSGCSAKQDETDSKSSRIGWEDSAYWDKLELNVLGNINI